MTNEQLAFLIGQIADNIYALADEIEPLIADGAKDQHFEWVWKGEGEMPFLDHSHSTEGWEYILVQETYKAVAQVRLFAHNLVQGTVILRGGKK